MYAPRFSEQGKLDDAITSDLVSTLLAVSFIYDYFLLYGGFKRGELFYLYFPKLYFFDVCVTEKSKHLLIICSKGNQQSIYIV